LDFSVGTQITFSPWNYKALQTTLKRKNFTPSSKKNVKILLRLGSNWTGSSFASRLRQMVAPEYLSLPLVDNPENPRELERSIALEQKRIEFPDKYRDKL
jgi:hypothetical protein